MDKRKKGGLAENITAKWLQKYKGYKIVERNYTAISGEIDIIALDGKTCVFIEVKYRKGIVCGYPSEAVNLSKQEKIVKTAMIYLENRGYENIEGIRFDVAEVINIEGKNYIRYIENAFEWRNCK